ncbi:MAG: DUF1080 domain-containing protein [Bacteroidota bacterium]
MKQYLHFVFFAILLYGCKKDNSIPLNNNWTSLLTKDLSFWDKFIGVPHYSIIGLPDHPKGDGMNGIPLGLNNDPLNVFSVEEIDGELVLHISGEIYGGLSTKQEYGNYHFKAEFKWGEQKYEPRLDQKRDNGLLYHAYGLQGAFWNVWMNSQEFQIQEGDMGDYFALGPVMDIQAENIYTDNEQAWIYNPDKPAQMFGDTGVSGRCRRIKNMERANWNTLELICLNNQSIHVVNGKVVMVLNNSRLRNSSGIFNPLIKGKIQIQSEGAEAYFRNIQIKPITQIPEPYR